MHSRRQRLGAVTAAAALATALSAGTALAAPTERGPSSSADPYVLPSAAGVMTTSILTAGDSIGGYRMAGTPDGLGAFDNHDGTFTLLSNHEFTAAEGRVRDHGATGSFVSSWRIRKDSLKVLSGHDLIQQVALWDPATSTYKAPAKSVAFTRFCSATLAERTAFSAARSSDRSTGRHEGVAGYQGRLFTNGEESGPEGRAFAHAADGTSYELPAMGKMAFENVVPNPGTRKRAVAGLTDDGLNGQVYMYAGDKQRSGNPAERAGLNNGKVFGIKVDGLTDETDATSVAPGTRFAGVDLGDRRTSTGAKLDADSEAAGVTSFQRPEDGSWDPENPRVFVFDTTASFTGNSRSWKLTFDDPAHPERGGSIVELLQGSEAGHKMLDNIGIAAGGNALVQEDPGNNPYVARIHALGLDAPGRLTEVATHDPALFTPGAPGFITQDEESSGIIDAGRILGRGWWLLADQIHKKADPEIVEMGQFTAMYVPTAGSGHGQGGDDGEADAGRDRR